LHELAGHRPRARRLRSLRAVVSTSGRRVLRYMTVWEVRREVSRVSSARTARRSDGGGPSSAWFDEQVGYIAPVGTCRAPIEARREAEGRTTHRRGSCARRTSSRLSAGGSGQAPGRLTARSSPPGDLATKPLQGDGRLRPEPGPVSRDLDRRRRTSLRYFILVASITLDPAAVLLLLAATSDNKLSGTVRCVLAPVHIVAVSNRNSL
jgi:hypothetical protein